MTRKRDTSKKRESILDAAVKVFQAEGYETASMDRIAEVAAASKRTVYNHFESKEKLFLSIVERFAQETCGMKHKPYDSDRSIAEQLKSFADVKIQIVDNPSWAGVIKVTIGVFIKEPELAKQIITIISTDDYFTEWLEAAKVDKKLEFDDAELTANVFWSMVCGALFWPRILGMMPESTNLCAVRDEIVETFIARYER